MTPSSRAYTAAIVFILLVVVVTNVDALVKGVFRKSSSCSAVATSTRCFATQALLSSGRQKQSTRFPGRAAATRLHLSENEPNKKSEANIGEEEESPIIIRGTGEDTLPDDIWDDIESGQPSQWSIMKELLGISVFTYILAAAIVLFLSLNAILGPGWLGQAIGVKGTGSFSEISDSLPDSIDLSGSDYLL